MDGDDHAMDPQAVRAAAFAALIRNGQASLVSVARGAGLSLDRTRKAAELLTAAGFMVLQDDGVVGVAGLSLLPSTHRLRLEDRTWHTWCAYDSVGIPAALGADAVVDTRCPACSGPITLTIEAGRPPAGSSVTGWLPLTTGADPLHQFCPLANLFCTPGHLQDWVSSSGGPAGSAASLDDLAGLGVEHWGPLV